MVVRKIGFHLLVGKFALAHKFCRLVEDVRTGQLFTVLFRAILRNEQKRLLLHRIVFEKFEDALHFVGFEIFFCALQDLIKFAVEGGIFFGADGFGTSCGSVYGKIFYKQRLAGEDAHQVAFLPEGKDFDKLLFGQFQQFCARRRIEVTGHLTEVQPVQIDAHGVAVRLRQIFCDELIFHARKHV